MSPRWGLYIVPDTFFYHDVVPNGTISKQLSCDSMVESRISIYPKSVRGTFFSDINSDTPYFGILG